MVRTGYALSQVLGVAAQRAINDMRQVVQAHVSRLPVRYFDSTQTGVLISRIMNDAEGLRNLVGTGIVQLLGGIVTAVLALGVLFWVNWKLTLVILAVLAVFGGGMAWAFQTLQPLFRERGKITAEITGRLAQTLGSDETVLAGERHSERIAGFALGNSPREMTPEAVKVRTLIMTTTNGTAALLAVASGNPVYVAAAVNLSAVAERARAAWQAGEPILVVCAGREQRFALADAYAAGRLIEAKNIPLFLTILELKITK